MGLASGLALGLPLGLVAKWLLQVGWSESPKNCPRRNVVSFQVSRQLLLLRAIDRSAPSIDRAAPSVDLLLAQQSVDDAVIDR